MSGALRTNYRPSPKDFEGFIGCAVVAGSFLPAAAGGVGGASYHYGGFVMGSFGSQLSGAGFFQLSAVQALSAFYGTVLHSAGSGFKVIPIAFWEMSTGDGNSGPLFFRVSATQALASTDSIVVIAVQKASQAVGSGIVYTSASNISVRFTWFGWIVSSP